MQRMRKFAWIYRPLFGTCLTVSLGLAALAHDGDHAPVAPVGHADLYRPSALPDRVILNLVGDPSTTIAVNWRTSTEVKHGLAEVAIAGAGPNFRTNAKQLHATTTALKTDINEAHFHSVTFSDLTPGTRYAYRVGDGTNWSEWFHYSTATKKVSSFSFVYFGDAQNAVRSMWSRVIREAQRDAPKAAFMLHAGDLVNRGNSDGEWGEWFGAGAWLNAMMPSLAIPGNHEQVRTSLLSDQRRLTDHWRPAFTFPENGPPGLEETCYTLTYHNLRIIALNSNEKQDVQAHWLENVLEQNTSEWVVCTFHHPIFSTGKGRDNPELRSLWKPIFDKYKVDLVLQGHDHTYGRTGLKVPHILDTAETDEEPPLSEEENVATGKQAYDVETGTLYVVSVSGPKMYTNTNYEFMRRVAEDTQLYQIIHIDGGRLRFEARTAIGELYDSFELNKRPGKVNELIEFEQSMPARLRDAEPKENAVPQTTK